jgi:hypothetical protein
LARNNAIERAVDTRSLDGERMTMVAICLAAYAAVALLLYGSIFAPLALAIFWSDRLGAPNWQVLAAAGIALSALMLTRPLKTYINPLLRLPFFVAASLTLSTLFVGAYADSKRHEAVLAFAADQIMEHSFFQSIRRAPQEGQFYLHTAALKHCVPYAWSYREMTFHELVPNVAANVLPQNWLDMCSIRRQN